MILSVVILAPILEEYLFREYFLQKLKSPKAKIIITALSFAISPKFNPRD